MYNWTRPFISVPVHGEQNHLIAHSKLAQSCLVPFTKILENGNCLKLAPNQPELYGKIIEVGKMIVEGKKLYDVDSDFIKDRRKFSFEGIILVSIIIYQDFTLHKDVKISFNGLPPHKYEDFCNTFKSIFIEDYLTMCDENKSSDLKIGELIKKTVRKMIKEDSGKKPQINSHIIRI